MKAKLTFLPGAEGRFIIEVEGQSSSPTSGYAGIASLTLPDGRVFIGVTEYYDLKEGVYQVTPVATEFQDRSGEKGCSVCGTAEKDHGLRKHTFK